LEQTRRVGVAKSERPRLTNGEIIFEEFQPMWSHFTNVTDGRTDRRTDDMRSQYRTLHWSASRGKKHQRQKSDNANANIPASAAVLRCPSLCCAWAMQKSFSFNQAESYTPLWRGALQRLQLPDIKVRCGRYKWSLQQDGDPSHTARNIETCSVRTFSSLTEPNILSTK